MKESKAKLSETPLKGTIDIDLGDLKRAGIEVHLGLERLSFWSLPIVNSKRNKASFAVCDAGEYTCTESNEMYDAINLADLNIRLCRVLKGN